MIVADPEINQRGFCFALGAVSLVADVVSVELRAIGLMLTVGLRTNFHQLVSRLVKNSVRPHRTLRKTMKSVKHITVSGYFLGFFGG